jgi:two-component system sensor histidine kinase ChiS
MDPRTDAKAPPVSAAAKAPKRTRLKGEEAAPSSEGFRTNLLALMGHELRTPLNAVMTLSQLLLDGGSGALSPEQRRYVEVIHRNGESVLRLLGDFLDLARLEGRNLPLTVEAFDVRDAVRRVIANLGALAETKGLELAFNTAATLPAVQADRERVGQILTNLVGNAIKFTDKGRVTVSTELFDRSVAIHVADTGIGIPRSAFEGLFTEFYQVDPAESKKRGGCGLGLALTKRLVTQMGGDIWVSSKVGEGSRFSFTLPREAQPREATSRAPGTTPNAG